MTKKKFIPYGKQSVSAQDIKRVAQVLKSDFLTTGPETVNFEKNFQKKIGSKYALSCSNGTAGLHLAFLAIELKKNDVVVLPVVNFIASANMAYNLGAKIFFADVDSFTGQITPETLIACIKKNKITNIKTVITMYNGGSANNYKNFYNLKKKYNFFLIEDACHALGSKYSIKKNLKVGCCRFSDISVFSFHPIKSITTGEGGMLTTNNKVLFNRINLHRNHGIVRKKSNKLKYHWHYKILTSGYNYRLSDISCALGDSQLSNLENFISKRQKIFNHYLKRLKSLNEYIFFPAKKEDQVSANHLFIIHLKLEKIKISRDLFIQKLYKKKILTQVHYIPVYDQPFYKKIIKSEFPNANKYYKSCLSLPIFNDLSFKDIDYISLSIKEIIEKFKKN